MKSSNHVKRYFKGIKNISDLLIKQDIEDLAKEILKIKKKGKNIFFGDWW